MTEPASERTDPGAIERAVIDAAMTLAAERGWRAVTLADVAVAAGLPMADLYDRFPTKSSILAAIGRRADIAAGTTPAAADDRPRDRLFDAMMRRFDALAAHRAGLRAVLRELPSDPIAALCAGPAFARSMRWTVEAAGLATGGIAGAARVKAAGAAYLAALAVWIDDETPDQSRTMARLDRTLRRLDGWTRLFGGERSSEGPANPAAA
ncbi:MAG: TetR family transcriptional regulator [Alphaproteobacteria bacterium]